MGDGNAECTGAFDLRAGFALNLGQSAVQQFGVERQVAIGIKQAGDFAWSGNWPPTKAGPLAIERDVNAQIGLRMRFAPAGYLGEPWTGDHHAGGSDPAFFQSLQGGAVDGM